MKLGRMIRLYIDTTDGMTQKQLAAETGVNESTISRFLSGEQMPDATAFSKLLAWTLGEHIPPTKLDDIQKQVNELNRRTFGLVRLGGR